MTVTVNSKVVGAGALTSMGVWEDAIGGSSDTIYTFPFSAAGTYLVALGEMKLLGVFLTTSVVGSIVIKDSIEGVLGPTVQNITTAVGANVLWTAGTPPDYVSIYSGLHMVVTGTNVGYVMFSAREV